MQPVIQKHLRQPEWSATVQAVSGFTVDMIHKHAGFFLLIVIQTLAFWNHIPYVFMVLLNASFLPGRVRIAVKDFGANFTIFITLQSFWKLKFHTIISQDYREQFLKKMVRKACVLLSRPPSTVSSSTTGISGFS